MTPTMRLFMSTENIPGQKGNFRDYADKKFSLINRSMPSRKWWMFTFLIRISFLGMFSFFVCYIKRSVTLQPLATHTARKKSYSCFAKPWRLMWLYSWGRYARRRHREEENNSFLTPEHLACRRRYGEEAISIVPVSRRLIKARKKRASRVM